MQAVILAAGKSTRTYPLTLTKPKPLLKILNKTILEHLLDELLECNVEEAILIVGYKKEMIIEKFGKNYKGMKLTYVEQKEQLGTMHALYLVKDLIKDRFMVLYGDDLLHHEDLKEGLKYENSMLVLKTKTPERFGIAITNEEGLLQDIIEKPKEFVGDLASVGGFVFEKKFLNYELVKEEGQEEYFLPTTLRNYCKNVNVKVLTIKRYWLPTGYPWDLINASEVLIEDLQEEINGEIENGATIKGALKVGEGTLIKSGVYIEGPVIIGNTFTLTF
ncbi:MAG: NTP transferase domain-containing protein, partial [Nanoarchaeota archaeon]|nr:NTP transferase domain-containing protein [Nanoarchaeota archaeon]